MWSFKRGALRLEMFGKPGVGSNVLGGDLGRELEVILYERNDFEAFFFQQDRKTMQIEWGRWGASLRVGQINKLMKFSA